MRATGSSPCPPWPKTKEILAAGESTSRSPDVVPDCELLRAVVETSEEMWRQSTVEEFVSSASTFNANDIPFPEEEPD